MACSVNHMHLVQFSQNSHPNALSASASLAGRDSRRGLFVQIRAGLRPSLKHNYILKYIIYNDIRDYKQVEDNCVRVLSAAWLSRGADLTCVAETWMLFVTPAANRIITARPLPVVRTCAFTAHGHESKPTWSRR